MKPRTLSFDFSPREEREAEPVAKDEPRVLAVAELGRLLRGAVEARFREAVWVEGEVVGARLAQSGHLYFQLKDEREDATVDVAMYKYSLTAKARSLIENGARIRMRGKPNYWVPRGKLQFVCERVDAAGRGALLEALERLKKKLAAEGLFDDARKRPLPSDARTIGVVTSEAGAVIHDIYRVAFKRGGARIILAPAMVQGARAPDSLARAIAEIGRVRDLDAIIVGRGGGSADDLMPFNDERVVRAIAACPVPVVSAVGHEVDVTLTDFVADARAATPSQAAELLVADRSARQRVLEQATARLGRTMMSVLADRRNDWHRLSSRMGDPRLVLAGHEQTLDDLRSRLAASTLRALRVRQATVSTFRESLYRQHPARVIAARRDAMRTLTARLLTSHRAMLEERRLELTRFASRLDAMSPLKVLSRGYAIVTTESGVALRRAQDARVGDSVTIRAHEAKFGATIARVEEFE